MSVSLRTFSDNDPRTNALVSGEKDKANQCYRKANIIGICSKRDVIQALIQKMINEMSLVLLHQLFNVDFGVSFVRKS